jgi:uncharacterized membrane protein YdbT with pleckstrin-like domain
MTVDMPMLMMRPARAAFWKEYTLVVLLAGLVFGLPQAGFTIPDVSVWAAAILSAMILCSIELNRLRFFYKLTSSQAVIERGLIKRTRKAVFLDNIVDVNFRQGYIERLLNYGTIIIGSSGGRSHEECELKFERVNKPKHFVLEIERLMKGYAKGQ